MLPNFSNKFTKLKSSKFSNIGGSFQGGQSSRSSAPKAKKKLTFQMFYGLLVFVLTLLISLGAFAYTFILDSRIDNLSASIESQRETFQLETIQTLDAFEKQLSSFSTILIQRSNFVPILQQAAALVAPNVFYNSITITSEDNAYLIEVEGQSSTFSSYLTQSRIFFEDIGLLAKGTVESFSIRQSEELGNYIIFRYVKRINPFDIEEFIRRTSLNTDSQTFVSKANSNTNI